MVQIWNQLPYASAWAQIQASNAVPTITLPTIVLDEASGGRAVDYSCSEEMHTFLNWLGENNRPLGVRRAVSALAQLDSSVRGYLTEAEDLAPQTRTVMDAILNDEAVAALTLFRAVLKTPSVSWGGSDLAELDAVWDKAVEIALPAPAELLPLELFQLPEAEAEFAY